MSNKAYVLSVCPDARSKCMPITFTWRIIAGGRLISGPSVNAYVAWAQAANNLRNHRELTLGGKA